MATVPIQIVNNAIYVQAEVNGHMLPFVIDTGDAVGPVFNSADAQVLRLENLGPIGVSGAGGSVEIFRTEASIDLGGLEFPNEPGAVDNNLQGISLLGLPFFIRQGGILAFDFANKTLTFGPAKISKNRRVDVLLEDFFQREDD